MKLHFIGADHEVTGSAHLIKACGLNMLVDYGMEQGVNVYENMPLPMGYDQIHYVFLTHAHIDHCGRIPLLIKRGFKGTIYCSSATADLLDVMLKDSGYILNVASAAAFAPGPYMAAYYASKAYVLRLTQAAAFELSEARSNVSVSALCPGPVETEFNQVAGVNFSVSPLSSRYVAKYAIQQMFKGKTVIIPGTSMKLAAFASKVVPSCVAAKITAEVQKHKQK